MHSRDRLLLCVIFKKKRFLEVGLLNHRSEYIMERNPVHVIVVRMDFSTVAGLQIMRKCMLI